MPKNFQALVWDARKLVGYTNRAFANVTGASLRTVERHSGSAGISNHFQTQRLIAAVYPKDANLARQLAEASGLTLEALGLGQPPPAAPTPAQPPVVAAPLPPSPPPVPEARPEHADSVLLAAANALNVPPQAVLPAVAAAFAKAKELGVSLSSLADRLSLVPPAPRAKPGPPPKP
jgi:hypothetical protein